MDEIRAQDRRHPRHPGRGDGAARRPADRQADPGPARRARSRRCCRRPPRRSPRCWRSIPTSAISTTACRCPASTGRSRSNKAEAAKYGAGSNTVGTRRAARHQRRQGHRISARPTATRRSTSWCASRRDRRSLDQIDDLRVQTPVRPRADRQFRRARAGAARRLHQPRRRQPRDDGVGQRRRRRAEREGAAGDHAGTRQADLGPACTLRLKGEDEERAKASAPS